MMLRLAAPVRAYDGRHARRERDGRLLGEAFEAVEVEPAEVHRGALGRPQDTGAPRAVRSEAPRAPGRSALRPGRARVGRTAALICALYPRCGRRRFRRPPPLPSMSRFTARAARFGLCHARAPAAHAQSAGSGCACELGDRAGAAHRERHVRAHRRRVGIRRPRRRAWHARPAGSGGAARHRRGVPGTRLGADVEGAEHASPTRASRSTGSRRPDASRTCLRRTSGPFYLTIQTVIAVGEVLVYVLDANYEVLFYTLAVPSDAF